jgi:hypothetical protein
VVPEFQQIVTLQLIALPCQAGMRYAEMGTAISTVLLCLMDMQAIRCLKGNFKANFHVFQRW